MLEVISVFQSQNGLILTENKLSITTTLTRFQSQNGLILTNYNIHTYLSPFVFQSQNGLILTLLAYPGSNGH